jgi:hypothetical protein
VLPFIPPQYECAFVPAVSNLKNGLAPGLSHEPCRSQALGGIAIPFGVMVNLKYLRLKVKQNLNSLRLGGIASGVKRARQGITSARYGRGLPGPSPRDRSGPGQWLRAVPH